MILKYCVKCNIMFSRCRVVIVLIIMLWLVDFVRAQIAPNIVDSLGFKQGVWEEYRIPYSVVNQDVEVVIPQTKCGYYLLTKNKDRKLFPIIESKGAYKDGLKIGVWIEYYSNGIIKSQIEYKNGVPNGGCKMYWENGNLKMECVIPRDGNFLMLIYNEYGTLLLSQDGDKKVVVKSIYED